MKKIILLFSIYIFHGFSNLTAQNVGIGITTPIGKLHIKGTSNISQLLVDAYSPQANDFPLIRLRNSLGKDLMWIHSDDSTNVFIGLRAGRANNLLLAGAISNTFVGSDAGRSNTTASYNTIIGSRALYSNAEGGYNTASGFEALYSNAGGNFNTAYGMNALYSNVRLSGGTAIGYNAMKYANNTTEPDFNFSVAVGFEALRGSSNASANTGIANTALGSRSLRNNTAGYYNTASGTDALFNNTIGGSNTAIGYSTLIDNSIGLNNTATGSQALYANTTGSNNTAIGAETLYSITTGNDNTTIGYKASVSGDEISNATAIGSHAYAGASNSVILGSINGVNGATESSHVGIGTSIPNPSSVLDVNSTTKGFLPPRMSKSERNSIVSPVEGLVVWCTNCGVYGQLQVHNGFVWTNMSGGIAADIPVIGDSEGGGIVAYVLQPGDPGYVAGENHGLIAAPSDQAIDVSWGCGGTLIPGADGLAIGTGNQNTIDIVNECSTPGIAARICYDLVLGGYSDWYLPSKDELNKLYINRVAIGGFLTGSVFDKYWSSSEYDMDFAWNQNFSSGNQSNNNGLKVLPNNYVRAIRAF